MSDLAQHQRPFDMGECLFNTTQSASTDTLSNRWLGKEFVFKDEDPTNNGAVNSGEEVRVRVCRNDSGITLTGKQLVSLTPGDGGFYIADGYADSTAEAQVFPVDPYVTNVYPLDFFYVITKGPATVKTAAANGEGNNIAAGNLLIAATAAASTNTTAGRVSKEIDITGSSQATDIKALIDLGRGAFARALSAATTNETDTEIRCYVFETTW